MCKKDEQNYLLEQKIRIASVLHSGNAQAKALKSKGRGLHGNFTAYGAPTMWGIYAVLIINLSKKRIYLLYKFSFLWLGEGRATACRSRPIQKEADFFIAFQNPLKTEQPNLHFQYTDRTLYKINSSMKSTIFFLIYMFNKPVNKDLEELTLFTFFLSISITHRP